MKRRTYNNMLKATKIIVNKGYSWDEANEIAIQCFDTMDQTNNGMDLEWFLNKIAHKPQ